MLPVTQVLRLDPRAPDDGTIASAAAALRQGRLVAFPTETVYGLGAHALDRDAVRRIFVAKGRPSTDPLIVHVATVAQVEPLVRVMPHAAIRLADAFWPGPLTLVLQRAPQVPLEVTAGLETVAVRVPSHPVAHALLTAAAIPIAAPSANLFSRPSPTTAAHVLEDLRDRIDIVLDGGPTSVGVESTVVDLTGLRPAVLRPGAITEAMLRQVVADIETRRVLHDAAIPATSPGTLARHYSPRAPLTLYEGPPEVAIAHIRADADAARQRGQRVGIVAMDEDDIQVGQIVRIGPATQADVVAARLYAALRRLDSEGVDLILARQFPSEQGLGRAIRDRLSRAAAGRIVSCG